ncbi:MAG: hypothetical protein IID05_00025 [Gemmatimonadetes bacterium]|nr:hypothetical protein [Gemmatimonadota bacterium]
MPTAGYSVSTMHVTKSATRGLAGVDDYDGVIQLPGDSGAQIGRAPAAVEGRGR